MHSNPASRAAGPFIVAFVVATAVPVAWHLQPILPLPDALALGVAVALAAGLFALVVGRLGRIVGGKGQAVLVALAAAVTIWSEALVLTDIGSTAQAAIVAAGGVVAAIVFAVARQSGSRGRPSRATTFVVLAAVLAALPVPAWCVIAGKLPYPETSVKAPQVPGIAPADYVTIPKFVQHPNLYVVGMLAAVPDSLLERHLGIAASPLNSYLGGGEFRVFHNVFSETYPTRNSLDLLLALDREYLEGLGDFVAGGLVSGVRPSPLLTIFAENGYETNALYEDTKFGAVKGPNLDNYEIATPQSLCTDALVESSARSMVFFGACQLSKALPLSLLRPTLDDVFATHLGRIAAIAARDRPQLTILQLRPPFHYTGEKLVDANPAAVADFAARYQRSTSQAAVNLERLMRAIRENDPNGIVFVFGDQGLGLSKDLEAAERTAFFVQDKLGVAAAVSPAETCREFLPTDRAGSLTTVEIVADLIRCLSGGMDIYRSGYEHRAMVNGETFELAPYTYE